jgi:two-component system, chemotaxis family, sensor histidine kinase and response regulator WspE
MSADDLGHFSMADLFRLEVEHQGQVLTSGLLTLERDSMDRNALEECMRVAHSLKGAARVLGLTAGVNVAHAMEDCFVAAQQGRVVLGQTAIDVALKGVDLLTSIATTPEEQFGQWEDERRAEVDAFLATLTRVVEEAGAVPIPPHPASPSSPGTSAGERAVGGAGGSASADASTAVAGLLQEPESSDRVVRVTAEHVNRLLALAGESLVQSRLLKPFASSLARVKRAQHETGKRLERLRDIASGSADQQLQDDLADLQRCLSDCQQQLSKRLIEIAILERRCSKVSQRLYDEALASRMRPLADGIGGVARMVRDLARSLGKRVRLEIVGEATQVDRDILAALDAPLGHLLRNALDHGLEGPDERRAAGKPEEGVLRLEAHHRSGVLQVIVADDGRGIDLRMLRETVVRRNLASADSAESMSDGELLEFLFLPGFSLKETVTDVSGRGVGLDVVQDMVKRVRGTVRVASQRGKGTRVQLQLPVTLSVVRCLLAEIGGEAYAFPLAHIARAITVPHERVERLEGRQYFDLDGRSIGLVAGHQVFAVAQAAAPGELLPVIVIGDAHHAYGVIVEKLLGERELVVQPLDPRLGKVKDIAAGALMEDGLPVLIVDTDDVIRSVDRIVSDSRVASVPLGQAGGAARERKRVLVVDDSLTVRELERKLLGARGYDVEVAVDGMDGWNAVRTGQFNLVVTDIDMPRMDGIELVSLITSDPRLKSIPVVVVSYKDRDEDRRRGLQAGAAHYLTKGSFHDDTLVQAVVDLIGEPDA